jgi:hypothetical protein
MVVTLEKRRILLVSVYIPGLAKGISAMQHRENLQYRLNLVSAAYREEKQRWCEILS